MQLLADCATLVAVDDTFMSDVDKAVQYWQVPSARVAPNSSPSLCVVGVRGVER